MGSQEDRVRKSAKRNNLKKFILVAAGNAALLNHALTIRSLNESINTVEILHNKRQREYMRTAAGRMLRQRLLRLEGGSLRLTKAGERELRQIQMSEFGRTRQKKWDGKWRVLIFDVPERQKYLRERIRHMLVTIGFQHLQHSVWIYPFDCEDLVTLLKVDMRIGSELLYMIVDSIENDQKIKCRFGL